MLWGYGVYVLYCVRYRQIGQLFVTPSAGQTEWTSPEPEPVVVAARGPPLRLEAPARPREPPPYDAGQAKRGLVHLRKLVSVRDEEVSGVAVVVPVVPGVVVRVVAVGLLRRGLALGKAKSVAVVTSVTILVVDLSPLPGNAYRCPPTLSRPRRSSVLSVLFVCASPVSH